MTLFRNNQYQYRNIITLLSIRQEQALSTYLDGGHLESLEAWLLLPFQWTMDMVPNMGRVDRPSWELICLIWSHDSSIVLDPTIVPCQPQMPEQWTNSNHVRLMHASPSQLFLIQPPNHLSKKDLLLESVVSYQPLPETHALDVLCH